MVGQTGAREESKDGKVGGAEHYIKDDKTDEPTLPFGAATGMKHPEGHGRVDEEHADKQLQNNHRLREAALVSVDRASDEAIHSGGCQGGQQLPGAGEGQP